jgi:hypothetical protein
MSDPGSDIPGMLKGVGFNASGIDKVVLGKGVVGKLTSALMAFLIVCFCGAVVGGLIHEATLVYSCVVLGLRASIPARHFWREPS